MKKYYNYKIIFFDGVCNLCSGTVKFIIKRDKKVRFKFASLQSEIGQEMSEYFNLPVNDFSSFVYTYQGKCYLKSQAALKVIGEFGGFWKMLLVLKILPKFIFNFFYDIVAKYRYKIFGKKDSCLIPDENIFNRFIDQT